MPCGSVDFVDTRIANEQFKARLPALLVGKPADVGYRQAIGRRSNLQCHGGQIVRRLGEYPLRVETGRFGASMQVSLVNDGPVSIWLDSDEILPGTAPAG